MSKERRAECLRCLDDLACLDALDTDIQPFDGSFDNDLDLLKVGKELTEGFTDNLGSGTAFSSDHTASFIFAAGCGSFAAYFTCLWHQGFPRLIKFFKRNHSILKKISVVNEYFQGIKGIWVFLNFPLDFV